MKFVIRPNFIRAISDIRTIVKAVAFNYKEKGQTPIIIGEPTSDSSEFKSFDYIFIS
ncbi:MAG: palindromic element RPE2 domain-containing protein [Rickettsia endosymbiont of Pentastiridius leporinus]